MRKRILIVWPALAGLFFAGCVSYRYIPVERDEVQVLLDRGESVGVLDDGILRIIASAADEGEHVRFDLDIANLTEDTVRVDEQAVQIRQGVDPDHLEDAKITYPAGEYYKKESSAAAAMACCLAVGAVAATADAIRHPSAENRLDAHIAAENLGDNLEESTERLDYLKQNLLFSSDIPAGGGYGGIVYGILFRPANDTTVKNEPAAVSITLRIRDKDYVFTFERRKS